MVEKGNEPQSMSDLADAAFSATAEQVLRRARATGTDIVVWRNGRIVRTSPEDFELEKQEDSESDRDQS
jgi:hypothetical protein